MGPNAGPLEDAVIVCCILKDNVGEALVYGKLRDNLIQFGVVAAGAAIKKAEENGWVQSGHEAVLMLTTEGREVAATHSDWASRLPSQLAVRETAKSGNSPNPKICFVKDVLKHVCPRDPAQRAPFISVVMAPDEKDLWANFNAFQELERIASRKGKDIDREVMLTLMAEVGDRLEMCNADVTNLSLARFVQELNETNDAECQSTVADDSTVEVGATGRASNPNDSERPKPICKKEMRTKWLAEAMLLVRDHPERSNAEIARQVGIHPSTLSRSREYQAAAALARQPKTDPHRGHMSIDPDTGQQSIEAYFDDAAEHDWDE